MACSACDSTGLEESGNRKSELCPTCGGRPRDFEGDAAELSEVDRGVGAFKDLMDAMHEEAVEQEAVTTESIKQGQVTEVDVENSAVSGRGLMTTYRGTSGGQVEVETSKKFVDSEGNATDANDEGDDDA